jgi:hypothetical protein
MLNTQSSITANSRVTVQAAGTIAVILTDSIFRERVTQQLQMAGYIPETMKIDSGYGVIERDFTMTITLRTQAPTTVSNLVGSMASALEKAGSYSPLITIPSIGQPAQTRMPGAIDAIADTVGSSLGNLAETASEVPGRLLGSVNLVIVGIVVLGALIAFGPNIGKIAGAATRR